MKLTREFAREVEGVIGSIQEALKKGTNGGKAE